MLVSSTAKDRIGELRNEPELLALSSDPESWPCSGYSDLWAVDNHQVRSRSLESLQCRVCGNWELYSPGVGGKASEAGRGW